MTREARHVIVVGGGVAGLTAAYRLTEVPDAAHVAVTVLEADRRIGGKLRSVDVGGLRLEAGADSFVARKPWAIRLSRELGLGSELVHPGTSGAYLWTRTGLVPFPSEAPFGIPGDVGDVLRWPGLSRRGRLRALADLTRRTRKEEVDESLGSLLRRRLGDEATERAVAPLLAGLHAADVDRLSVLATFPELVEWERRQGSLIRGSQAARRAARDAQPIPMFAALRGGTARLIDALAERVGLGHVVTDSPAGRIEPRSSGYVVHAGTRRLEADAVVLAVPAFEAARLLADVAAVAAAELGRIRYVSTAVVLLVYPEGTRDGLPDGTGFVVPAGAAPMTAATWLSSKWPREEFGSRAVVRCYVGAEGSEDVIEAPDDDIVQACARHLAAVVDLPDEPEAAGVVRWRRAMPQYEVGHLDRVRTIRDGLPSGMFVTGSAYGGIGIADCVADANEAATQIRRSLAGTRLETRETVR